MIYYALALFRYDIKQTIKFIGGLSFGVALCQLLSVLTNTPVIMSNYAVVSPLLENDIWLFQIFVILMFFLYLPILHWHLFQIQREELSHFFIAGMSQNNTKKLFFLEVCLLDVFSIGIGLGLDEILLFFTRYCIRILIQSSVSFPLVYATQIKQFGIEIMLAVLVTFLFTLIGIEKEQINKWISKKLIKVTNKKRTIKINWAYVAGALSVTTIAFMILKFCVSFSNKDMLELVCFPMGIGLIFMGMDKISIFFRKDKSSFQLLRSHKKLSYHSTISAKERFLRALKLEILRKDKGLIQIISLWISIFLIGMISFALTQQGWKIDDMKSTPFDFVSVTYDKSPSITSNQVMGLLNVYKNQIKDSTTFSACRDNAFSYFSIKDINRIFHTNYKIKRGYFLQDYRIYRGYTKKDFLSTDRITQTLHGEDYSLKKQGDTESMLFGYHHSVADQLILLNDSDFQKIRQENSNIYKQKVVIVNWKKPSDAASFLKEIKLEYSAQIVYETFSSKVQNLQDITKADKFMMFTLVPIFLMQCSFGFEQYVFLKQKQKSRQKEDFFALRILGYNEKEARILKRNISIFQIKFICMEVGGIVVYFLLWIKVLAILS